MKSINQIPHEIIYEILLHLDIGDLIRFSQVNRHFHQICEDTHLWKFRFHQSMFPSIPLKFFGWKYLVCHLKNLSYAPEKKSIENNPHQNSYAWTQYL